MTRLLQYIPVPSFVADNESSPSTLSRFLTMGGIIQCKNVNYAFNLLIKYTALIAIIHYYWTAINKGNFWFFHYIFRAKFESFPQVLIILIRVMLCFLSHELSLQPAGETSRARTFVVFLFWFVIRRRINQ